MDLQLQVLLQTPAMRSQAQAGALIELTAGGKYPVTLPNGETRTFLEDGDALVIRGWCEKPGAARIDFGECVETVPPARSTSSIYFGPYWPLAVLK